MLNTMPIMTKIIAAIERLMVCLLLMAVLKEITPDLIRSKMIRDVTASLERLEVPNASAKTSRALYIRLPNC